MPPPNHHWALSSGPVPESVQQQQLGDIAPAPYATVGHNPEAATTQDIWPADGQNSHLGGNETGGETVPDRDGEIAAAIRGVFLDRSMVRPGPGWPVGRAARQRRDRRQHIDQELQDRRQHLQALLRTPPSTNLITNRRYGPARRAQRRLIAAALTVVVAAVWWIAATRHPEISALTARITTQPTGRGSAVSASPDVADAALQIDSTGVENVGSGISASPPRPAAPDLSTPVAAAVSWMIRWCPAHEIQGTGPESSSDLRETMTAAGWAEIRAELTPPPSTDPGWQAHCTQVRAAESIHAEHQAEAVVVVATATRTWTHPAVGSFDEPVSQQQRVVRGQDGLWRVDVTQGGA